MAKVLSQISWEKDSLMAICRAGQVHKDHGLVKFPKPRGPPIQSLPTWEGYACAINPNTCSYANKSPGLMLKHLKEHNNHPPGDLFSWKDKRSSRSATVQTLFKGNQRRWVEVEPALAAELSSSDPFQLIIQTIIPRLASIPPPRVSSSDKERTRFIAFMDWDNKMKDYIRDPMLRQSVMLLCTPVKRTSSKSPQDPLLRIQPLLVSFMKMARKSFGGSQPQGFAVRKHILHGRDLTLVQ